MINREMKSYTIKTFTEDLDDYGQQHTVYTTSEGTLFIRPYQRSLTDSPLYEDIELIALTRDNLGSNSNVIVNGKEYKIKFTIEPIGRAYRQLFLKLYEN